MAITMETLAQAQDVLVADIEARLEQFKTDYPDIRINSLSHGYKMNEQGEHSEGLMCGVSAKVDDAEITRTV